MRCESIKSCSDRYDRSDDNYHLSAGLIRFHYSVSFLDFVKAENSYRFGIESTSSDVLSNPLKRDVREREARRAEHETSEERQVDAARHLQQRIEIWDRFETAQPPGEAGAAAAAKHCERVEHDGVPHQVKHRINFFRL